MCVVTGSTGGIGLETARLLVAEGAPRRHLRARARRRGSGRRCTSRADLSEAGRAGARRRRGGRTSSAALDVLVNNVGFAVHARFEEVTDERVGRDVAAERDELRARDPRGAAAHAGAASGAIVNVSSTAGKRPSTGMPHYSVTKAAVLSLSRLVADVYAGDGIRCNAVTPGPTATEAWLGDGGSRTSRASATTCSRRSVPGRPLGRLAEPEEIAAVIAFLCLRPAVVRHRRGVVARTAAPSRSSC